MRPGEVISSSVSLVIFPHLRRGLSRNLGTSGRPGRPGKHAAGWSCCLVGAWSRPQQPTSYNCPAFHPSFSASNPPSLATYSTAPRRHWRSQSIGVMRSCIDWCRRNTRNKPPRSILTHCLLSLAALQDYAAKRSDPPGSLGQLTRPVLTTLEVCRLTIRSGLPRTG